MKGYILVDNKLIRSTDPTAIAKAMPLIKGQLNRLAEMLDAESTDEQFNEQINSINTWLGFWNSNLEVLNRAKTIAAANNLISELTWPFEEPPASQSPS